MRAPPTPADLPKSVRRPPAPGSAYRPFALLTPVQRPPLLPSSRLALANRRFLAYNPLSHHQPGRFSPTATIRRDELSPFFPLRRAADNCYSFFPGAHMSFCYYRLIVSSLLAIVITSAAVAEEVCDVVKGSVIIAQDDQNTFLGKIASSFDSQSIFNEFGTYGNPGLHGIVWVISRG